MRELSSHKVNPANDRITIRVTDEPGDGGACHRYELTGFDTSTNPSADREDGVVVPVTMTTLVFQNGPIPERGVNGVTQEVLLAIIEDRLVGFQGGPFACEENENALWHVREAQRILQDRTLDRMDRGVEGTHEQ